MTRIFCILLTLSCIGSGNALAALTCPPMPAAVTDVSRDVKNEITASVGKLWPVKAGEINVQTEVVAKNLFEKFPNVDRVLALQIMSSTYCTMLDSSSISDTERLDRWEKFQERVLELKSQGPPSPQGAPDSPTTPTLKAGEVLYEADWSGGLNGWLATPGWNHVSNMLVSDGSPGHPARIWISAPYQPDAPNYAVEAEIQLLNPRCGATYKEFGLVARAQNQEGIIAGYHCSELAIAIGSHFFRKIATHPFDAGSRWHTYRLVLQGNVIKLFVDGAPVLETADNRYLSSGRVGMFSIGAQINVRSFKVIKL